MALIAGIVLLVLIVIGAVFWLLPVVAGIRTLITGEHDPFWEPREENDRFKRG